MTPILIPDISLRKWRLLEPNQLQKLLYHLHDDPDAAISHMSVITGSKKSGSGVSSADIYHKIVFQNCECIEPNEGYSLGGLSYTTLISPHHLKTAGSWQRLIILVLGSRKIIEQWFVFRLLCVPETQVNSFLTLWKHELLQCWRFESASGRLHEQQLSLKTCFVPQMMKLHKVRRSLRNQHFKHFVPDSLTSNRSPVVFNLSRSTSATVFGCSCGTAAVVTETAESVKKKKKHWIRSCIQ